MLAPARLLFHCTVNPFAREQEVILRELVVYTKLLFLSMN